MDDRQQSIVEILATLQTIKAMKADQDRHSFDADIRAFRAAGREAEAIKLYAVVYHVDEEEAQKALAALPTEGIASAAYYLRPPLEPAYREEMENLLREGKRIEAIRRFQQQIPFPLIAAKAEIKAWEKALGLESSVCQATPHSLPLDDFMIRWTVAIQPEKRLGSWRFAKGFIRFEFALAINGKSTPCMSEGFAVSSSALMASCQGDGSYEIFTCSCGVAECAGLSAVDVVHLDRMVLWEDRNENRAAYTFDAARYKAEINGLISPAFLILPRDIPTSRISQSSPPGLCCSSPLRYSPDIPLRDAATIRTASLPAACCSNRSAQGCQ
jgi:hypothetical protein